MNVKRKSDFECWIEKEYPKLYRRYNHMIDFIPLGHIGELGTIMKISFEAGKRYAERDRKTKKKKE